MIFLAFTLGGLDNTSVGSFDTPLDVSINTTIADQTESINTNIGVGDIAKFTLFYFTGIFLPSDTPITISLILIVWQVMFNLYFAGWIISSFWNG